MAIGADTGTDPINASSKRASPTRASFKGCGTKEVDVVGMLNNRGEYSGLSTDNDLKDDEEDDGGRLGSV